MKLNKNCHHHDTGYFVALKMPAVLLQQQHFVENIVKFERGDENNKGIKSVHWIYQMCFLNYGIFMCISQREREREGQVLLWRTSKLLSWVAGFFWGGLFRFFRKKMNKTCVDRLCGGLTFWNGNDSTFSPVLPAFSLSPWMWLAAGCWPPCDLQPEPSLISSVTSTLCGVARGQRISSGVSWPTALFPAFMWKDEPHPSPFFKILWRLFWSWEILWAANWQFWNVVQNLRRERSNKSMPQRHSDVDSFSCKAKNWLQESMEGTFVLSWTNKLLHKPTADLFPARDSSPLVPWHSEPKITVPSSVRVSEELECTEGSCRFQRTPSRESEESGI